MKKLLSLLLAALLVITMTGCNNGGGGEGGEKEDKLKIGVIYTMNCPRDFYESAYRPSLERTETTLRRLLTDTVMTAAACETLQVNDYGKYSMGRFDPEQRKAGREEQFPKDLAEAYALGAELAR